MNMSSSDQTRITVYISKDEKKWLQRIASDNLRSMASEARLMVLAGIKHYKEIMESVMSIMMKWVI